MMGGPTTIEDCVQGRPNDWEEEGEGEGYKTVISPPELSIARHAVVHSKYKGTSGEIRARAFKLKCQSLLKQTKTRLKWRPPHMQGFTLAPLLLDWQKRRIRDKPRAFFSPLFSCTTFMQPCTTFTCEGIVAADAYAGWRPEWMEISATQFARLQKKPPPTPCCRFVVLRVVYVGLRLERENTTVCGSQVLH